MAEHTVTTSRDTFVATLTAGAEPGTGPLASLRAEALERAATLPVPTTRDEEWRFTPLGALLELSYGPAPEATVSAEALEAFVLPEAVDSRLVFVNGRFQADLSSTAALGDGVRVGRLADALVGPQLGGFVTAYGARDQGVLFSTVHGAGHMSPQWRPEAVFHMFKQFLAAKPL